MSAEEQLSLSVIAIVCMIAISTLQLMFKFYNIKKERDVMISEAKILCMDLKRILTDCDKDNEEEIYEIELSLASYFKDNSLRLKLLADKLAESQPWYYKNSELKYIGKLLDWLISDFYDATSDEEERIRIWSQNVQGFHIRYSQSFHKESMTISHIQNRS